MGAPDGALGPLGAPGGAWGPQEAKIVKIATFAYTCMAFYRFLAILACFWGAFLEPPWRDPSGGPQEVSGALQNLPQLDGFFEKCLLGGSGAWPGTLQGAKKPAQKLKIFMFFRVLKRSLRTLFGA